MIKNSERCYSYEEIMEKPEYFAKRFSEGNSNLENLLNFCYSNGIITRACCIGHTHESGFVSDAYINLEIKPEQMSLFSVLINVLCESALKDVLTIDIDHTENCLMNTVIRVPLQYRNQLFVTTNDAFKYILNQNMTMSFENTFYKIFKIYSKLSSYNDENKRIGVTIEKNLFKFNSSRLKYFEELEDYAFGTDEVTDNKLFIDYLGSIDYFDHSNFSKINNSYILSEEEINLIYQMPFMGDELLDKTKISR